MSANTAVATHVGAIIASLFVMVILNLLASSSCQQLSKSIGEGERELARLEDERNREALRWAQMKTPERVEAALLHHGLSMKPPKASQNVHMNADGTLYRGQYSVSALRNRGTEKAARYKPTR